MHAPKRIAIIHPSLQKTFGSNYAVQATETWAVLDARPGYDDVVDRVMLPRPDSTPHGVRSVDPDSLAELVAVTYTPGVMVGLDAHAGRVLVLRGHDTDATKYTVDLLDPTTLAVLSSFDVTVATFAPSTFQNPRVALLPGAGPLWVATTNTTFLVLNAAAVTATITAPDAAFPFALACSTDVSGRLATTWTASGLEGKHKVVVYDTDLVTIIGEHTISNGGFDYQVRARGSTCFDPDGQTLWYYSGWFFNPGGAGEPSPTRRDKLYRFPVAGTTSETVEVADLGFGGLVIDGGGHVLVYGSDEVSTVRQRQIPAEVRQRQHGGLLRQRQNTR